MMGQVTDANTARVSALAKKYHVFLVNVAVYELAL